MPATSSLPLDESVLRELPPGRPGTQLGALAGAGAVSWGAIAAGAAAAASLSLVLLVLGVGLGLSSVSPWAGDGLKGATLGASAILWLALTQVLASGMGGYLAGRLRTRWTHVHGDEVYFRDTAHGFLAWAVASLATAALLTSTIGTILGAGVQASASLGGAVASAAATQDRDGGPMAYYVDALFRRDAPGTTAPGAAAVPDGNEGASAREVAEVHRIFHAAGRSDPLPAEDIRHVAQMVAQRTGLSQQDAEKRVASVYGQAQTRLRAAELAAVDAADKARKASAHGSLWLFVSLLVGAFVASLSATYGGRRRDA